MLNPDWVVLIYKIPSEPTKYRAAVWREIKRLGGVYLQNGVCIFPDVDDVSLNVSALADQIRNMDGSEFVFFTKSPTQAQAAEILDRFQTARDNEYQALFDPLRQLEAKTSSFNDTANANWLIDELKRVHRQYGVIKGRDYFDAPMGSQVGQLIQQLQTRIRQMMRGENQT